MSHQEHREDDPRESQEADERAPLLLNQEDDDHTIKSDEERHRLPFPWMSGHHRRLTFFEKVLLAVVLLLLCLASIFIGLFAGEKDAVRHTPVPTVTSTTTVTASPRPTSTPRNHKTCNSDDCVSLAAALHSGLDTSIDPCEDFYGFANNGWLAEHPIPQDKPLFGSAQAIDADNKRIIRSYLEGNASDALEKHPQLAPVDLDNLEHLQSVYQSCMNEDQLRTLKSQPLSTFFDGLLNAWQNDTLDNVGIFDPPAPLPPIPTDLPQQPLPRLPKPSRQTRIARALAYLHSYGVAALFEPLVSADIVNDPETLLLNIQPAQLGLPDPSYFQDKEATKLYRKAIQKSLHSVHFESGSKHKHKHDPHKHDAKHILRLEKSLAGLFPSSSELDDPKASYHPYNKTSFVDLTSDFLDAHAYFSAVAPGAVTNDSAIIVSWPEYLRGVGSLLSKMSDSTLLAYFAWRSAQMLGPLLSPGETSWKEINKMSAYLSGADHNARETRQDMCTQVVSDSMGLLVGHFYLLDAFSVEKKDEAEDIVEAVINAFVDRLNELEWLDVDTRQRAVEKANAMLVKIGYPSDPDVLNGYALSDFYSLQAPFNTSDYFGNALRAREAAQARMWSKVDGPVLHGEWDMLPTEVNAYYASEANEINLPAGQMHWPYFAQEAPEYLQFAGFGAATVGHELTHAFDKTGRQFDKDGKLTDWWSPETAQAYEERQQCIVDQYSAYTISDDKGNSYHVNGNMTIGEDVADAGGLAAAFRAWEDRFQSDPEGILYDNSLMPGSEYSREQLFFIAYARAWARNIRPAEAVQRVLTDPHSPTQYRVLGPLSNEAAFSKAFQCSEGSRYAPSQQCHLW